MKMRDDHSFRSLLHRAMHRIPGVPAHTERPAGRQSGVRDSRTRRHHVTPDRSPNRQWNHSPARQPRVMVAWQSPIAAFFGQKLS